MISRILFSIVLVLGLTAQAQLPEAEGECNYSTKGFDYFPWSIVLPFPWDSIQGVWKISTDPSIYLKARVINSTKNRKFLNVALVSTDRCTKPIASGPGYIDATEKNVVRAILSDGIYRYQIKLGMFESKALNIDSRSCGDSVLAATVKIIGTNPRPATKPLFRSNTEFQESQTHNMMLKKISSDLNAVCKKPIERKLAH